MSASEDTPRSTTGAPPPSHRSGVASDPDVTSEVPEVVDSPVPPERPDLDDGPDAAEAAGFGGITWADETNDPTVDRSAPVEPEPSEDLSFGSGAPDDAPNGDPGAEPAAEAEAKTGDGHATSEATGQAGDNAGPGPDAADPVPAAPAAPAAPGGDGTDTTAATVGLDGSEVTVEELVADLERVTAERDQYLDTSRRLQAEFENYRKQVSKREAEARERANEGLVGEILPVLDACDGALASGAIDVEPVQAALMDALVKQGLDRIDETGAPFDPAHHDAVMHEPDEGGDGPVVAEVMRAGYSWRGRVVRPAMVKVRG